MHRYIARFFDEFIAKYTILFFLVIILLFILIWTIAFSHIEWWTFFNSLYFTSVTLSTIWYGDMAPLTHAGKLISMFYGFMGAPLFIWITGIIFQSKIQKMIKASIHAYHRETKEAEKITEQLVRANKKQDKEIEAIEKEVEEEKK